MGGPEKSTGSDHPLAEAAERAALAAAARVEELTEHLARLRAGEGTSIADLLVARSCLEAGHRRHHEARRRLVTQQLARAQHVVLGQDFPAAARRLARLTLSEEVRGKPLDP